MISSKQLHDKKFYFARWNYENLKTYLKQPGHFCVIKRGNEKVEFFMVARDNHGGFIESKFVRDDKGTVSIQGFNTIAPAPDISILVEKLLLQNTKIDGAKLQPVERPPFIIPEEALNDLQETGGKSMKGAHGKIVRSLYAQNPAERPILVARKYGFKESDQDLLFRELLAVVKMPRHANIIFMHGMSVSKEVTLVMEWANNGSVTDYLAKNVVSNGQKLDWARQTARGLKFLQLQHIVHGDLHLFNLLLQDMTVKISDFGNCSLMTTQNANTDVVAFGGNVLRRLFLSPSGGKQSFSSQSESPAEGESSSAQQQIPPELEPIRQVVEMCGRHDTIDPIQSRLNNIRFS